jgi:glycosyltransferase involved in cell wall biosynthesis
MASLVSVLIPAFNAKGTIADTLRSAQVQSHRDLEIIVVDDGSSDDTATIVSRFEKDDFRIRLIRQENSGVAAARNTALKASSGLLIAPLDADDLWHPQKIELQVNNLSRNGDGAGLDYCWSVDIDEQSIIKACNVNRFEGDVYEALILANFIGNSSVPLIRRPLLETIGGWDESLRAANAQGCEDWLLYLKIAERSRIVLTPAFLVGYRQLPQAMSRNAFQMSRSYRMTMAQARSGHPEIPNSQFIKSGVDFDLYISKLSRKRIVELWFILHSMTHEPSNWRHHADVFRYLAQRLFKWGREDANDPTARAALHGLAFGSLPPDAPRDIG